MERRGEGRKADDCTGQDWTGKRRGMRVEATTREDKGKGGQLKEGDGVT